jgi:serine phosphatase RsbU (regulator of sigma subunit)
MFHKIKHKLFLCFLLFSSISLLSVIASVWFYKQKENVSNTVKKIDNTYILCLKEFKLQQDFLNYETINSNFFQTNESNIAQKQKEISKEISNAIQSLQAQNNTKSINATGALDSIQSELKRNHQIFEKIQYFILLRGFRDYGIEGQMRNHAHELMTLTQELNQVDILMLRRHEKDFIIRKDHEYVDKFSKLLQKTKNNLSLNKGIQNNRKQEIFSILSNYQTTFNTLVHYEKILGIKAQSGLLLDLSQSNERIQLHFEQQKEFAKKSEESIYIQLNSIAFTAAVLIIILAVFLSYFVASAITKPLVILSNSLKEYVNHGFEYFPSEIIKSSSYELKTLQENFVIMSKEITIHINFFKEKVEERTQEIQFQKDEIQHQQIEIVEQRDQLKIQKEILEIQKKVLMEKNKNMEDSIRYAKRIQKAILPQINSIKTILPDSFIYNQPKDIVSGDFYWIDKSNGDNSSKIFFAAVDCTGHGVPGAFMSIVGYNGLNKIIHEYKLGDPAEILNQLNQEVRQTLRQENNNAEIKDGMDIALCSLDKVNNILEFSGANSAMYLIRKNQLQIIKGDRFPIGVHKEEERPLFSKNTIKVEKGDAIYIFSDGYMDQFGGPKGKKFKQQKFVDMLLSVQDLEMEEQKIHIQKTIEIWQGNTFQVDDILVIGVKV